jgi:hypothetical protein
MKVTVWARPEPCAPERLRAEQKRAIRALSAELPADGL